MKKLFLLLFLFSSIFVRSQIDFSRAWEDLFSYNKVKDFVVDNDKIYALSDNAVFTYNLSTEEINKISSVQGLSGETTSSIFVDSVTGKIILGYENGFLEIIDESNNITLATDIANFSQNGAKNINHISALNGKLFLATPFAIIQYDIDRLEFGETFFIGQNSSDEHINETIIFNNSVFAATKNGIYQASVTNKNLIDFNNWSQFFAGRNFTSMAKFNNQIYVSETNTLYKFINGTLTLVTNFTTPIKKIKATDSFLTVTLDKSSIVLNTQDNLVSTYASTQDFDFTSNSSLYTANQIFIGTNEFGILKPATNPQNVYEEIHPEGPLTNDVFSISSATNNLWVVYGGYDITYTPTQNRNGYSNFDGKNWTNTRFNPATPYIDLNYVSIDPNNSNTVYISSYGDTRDINSVSTGGLLKVVDNRVTNFYNHLNSTLQDIESNDPSRVTVRVSGTTFDRQGNLWIASSGFGNELSKLTSSGSFTSYDLRSLRTAQQLGLSEIAIDNTNNIWMGTRRNGIYVFNENGNRKRALIATPNLGNLPDTDVLTVVADASNRIWLGTRNGLVVFNNAASVFSAEVLNAQPIIIEENGVGERLLGDQKINSIAIDGADNKWFGTENGGVLYTNPNGQRTIATFSKENSPLPSNRILKIAVDKQNGKVFFATDKGIVAYNSNVAPFGDELKEVYAYPNPALVHHNTVTITGRNGSTIPKGTNVKILDVAGNLVYETNVIEGQELQGGKVVWNKTNLAGRKVASGVYIVLLATEDASQTSTTKIAIVN